MMVWFFVLPSYITNWQHPGLMHCKKLETCEQVNYVISLIVWHSCTGYNIWHDFHQNENGVWEIGGWPPPLYVATASWYQKY